MYSLPIALATLTLVIGVSTLTTGFIARLPIWLRLFDLIVGLAMSLYALWALFWVDETVKIVYPTILYVLPFMAVIFSILYNYGRISWGIKDFEQTLKVEKTKKPRKSRSKDKEQIVLEETIYAEEKRKAQPELNEESEPVKRVNKTYIDEDGKAKEFKLPELF